MVDQMEIPRAYSSPSVKRLGNLRVNMLERSTDIVMD